MFIIFLVPSGQSLTLKGKPSEKDSSSVRVRVLKSSTNRWRWHKRWQIWGGPHFSFDICVFQKNIFVRLKRRKYLPITIPISFFSAFFCLFFVLIYSKFVGDVSKWRARPVSWCAYRHLLSAKKSIKNGKKNKKPKSFRDRESRSGDESLINIFASSRTRLY